MTGTDDSPAKRTWRPLADLSFQPAYALSMAWTGSVLVAVDAFPVSHATAWNAVTNTWRDIGRPLVAPQSATVGQGLRPSALVSRWCGRVSGCST